MFHHEYVQTKFLGVGNFVPFGSGVVLVSQGTMGKYSRIGMGHEWHSPMLQCNLHTIKRAALCATGGEFTQECCVCDH